MVEVRGYKPILISTIVDPVPTFGRVEGYKPILISTIVDIAGLIKWVLRL